MRCHTPNQNRLPKNNEGTHTQINKEATMDFDDKQYKTVVYINKTNQVVIKFVGFKNKNEADLFSQFITWELGIDRTTDYTLH